MLDASFLYCILSASSQDPKLHWGSRGPPRLGVAFPITSPLQLPVTQLARRTQLSYIIVRRPLDLWNRMFNRHQAEITVMQFTGHSLPVHQSMSAPLEFFSSSHFICQFPPTQFPLITAIRMCHLLPLHHLGMAFLTGSKGQNITLPLARKTLKKWNNNNNNNSKAKIDKTHQNSKCRLCGDRDETINHIISECSKLAQKENKTRHDRVGKVIHWKMCTKFKFDHTNRWYMHNPTSVLENDTHKLQWEFVI